MIEFSDLVQKCREKESRRIIYNASFEHARELFTNLFEEAENRKEDIYITSGNLSHDFYGALIEHAKKAISAGVKVNLIVLNPSADLSANSFYKLISEKGIAYIAKEEIKLQHFILVGEKRFRLEYDHNQAKAIASFNHPQLGRILKDQFDKIIGSDTVVRQSRSQ